MPASRQLRGLSGVPLRRGRPRFSTLAACIANTKASGSGGYTNDFLDPVATEPVADQASAVRVYTARHDLHLPQDTAQSGADFVAPRGAADVLRLAYPRLARRSAQRDFESHRLGFRIPPMAIERRLAAYQLGQSPVRPRHLG